MSVYKFTINHNNADNRITNTVDGISYDFRFRWNTREDAWYCYVGPAGSTPVAKFKMTTGTPDLLAPYKHLSGCPQGALLIYDVIAYYGRPTFDDFGRDYRYVVMYVEAEDL